MARVLGLEALRMADADVLPYDYVAYAREISAYIQAAKRKAADNGLSSLDFGPAEAAAARLSAAAQRDYAIEVAPSGNLARLNLALRQTETALLTDAGLPDRPWYRHTIYAPGEFTGYSAVVIPGVNEAIDAKNDQPRRAAVGGSDAGTRPRRAKPSTRRVENLLFLHCRLPERRALTRTIILVNH